MEKRFVGTPFVPSKINVCGTCGGRRVVLTENGIQQSKEKRSK